MGGLLHPIIHISIFARMREIVSIIAFCFVFNSIKAQDTLPSFTIRDINDKKILIAWTSTFGDSCIQLALQRSFDSTHFFTTIYSAQSPELPHNGVLDDRMPKGVKVFYRIFYVLQGGQYFFTNSLGLFSFDKMPFPLTLSNQNLISSTDDDHTYTQSIIGISPSTANQYLNIYKKTTDSIYERIELRRFRHLRDSLFQKKDTLYRLDSISFIIKTYTPKVAWKASKFVFITEATNAVTIKLPQPKLHKYRVVFFEENGTLLFEIKNPKDDNLVLDNTSFVHGGWFSFDLYEDEKLIEHSKFQLLIPF